jgi:hypothetical protein
MPKLLLVMVLTLLVAAPAAMAGTREDILNDCQSGGLDGNYTPSEIRDARNNIPADIDQYTNCRDVLGRALGGSGDKRVGGGGDGNALGGGGAGGGGGAAAPGEPLTPNGPEEQAALEKAAAAGGNAPVQVGDGTIVPGAAGLASDAARNSLPVSLLAVLILLGLAALAATVQPVFRRVHARRLS